MNGLASYAVAREVDHHQLVIQHAPLLKRIAYHLISRLPPSVQIDDLLQAGVVGLLEAARNYDPSQGASFETYASIRIRGAMLDELRRTDWTPRSVHRNTRKLAEVVHEIEIREGRPARGSEIAEALGLELDHYHKWLRDAAASRVVSVEETFPIGEEHADSQGGPFGELQQDGFREALAETIEGLPERERLVMAMYYDEELNLREIGEVLGVSESRVCQIHGQALVRIRARMKDWIKDEPDAG
jgi:RNA polymerase sigma factor for flagellar operon FliA